MQRTPKQQQNDPNNPWTTSPYFVLLFLWGGVWANVSLPMKWTNISTDPKQPSKVPHYYRRCLDSSPQKDYSKSRVWLNSSFSNIVSIVPHPTLHFPSFHPYVNFSLAFYWYVVSAFTTNGNAFFTPGVIIDGFLCVFIQASITGVYLSLCQRLLFKHLLSDFPLRYQFDIPSSFSSTSSSLSSFLHWLLRFTVNTSILSQSLAFFNTTSNVYSFSHATCC